MSEGEPFVFFTERRLVALTGRKASTLSELLEQLSKVSGSCIFYHTHYLHLIHRLEKPRFYNEFANWTSEALQEERIAERLAAIDLLAMTSIREIREALIAVIEKHIRDDSRSERLCPPGDEFHFCEAKSFVMSTGLVANNAAEFFQQVAHVTNACLHFHFFEARLRLGHPTNDFSMWLKDHGEPRLAAAIDRLNPYDMTLEELKEEIVKLGRKSLRR